VLVHAAYVLNTATADTAIWERARNGLAKELERSAALRVGAICFHPGSPGSQTWPRTTELRVCKGFTVFLSWDFCLNICPDSVFNAWWYAQESGRNRFLTVWVRVTGI
jgi:hypothetical protein